MSLARDKNIIIIQIWLKLCLVLSAIFQVIITEREPSLLCCFVPSSESTQKRVQPHMHEWSSTPNDTAVLQQPGSWGTRIHDGQHFKEQSRQWKTPQRRASAVSFGCSSTSDQRKGKQKPPQEKTFPRGWIGQMSLETKRFPERKSWRRSEEIQCILARGEFFFL